MDQKDYLDTRRSLHGIAESVMAGPQFRSSETIRLTAAPGGFATVRQPSLAVDGQWLLAGGQRVAELDGTTYARLAAAAGIDLGAPVGVYSDDSGVAPDETIRVDPAAAGLIARTFEAGDQALRRLLPGQTPVLWPEHFDLGCSNDEVNFGVSPGDAAIAEPYAYVGPWTQRTGEFWNQSFGAARTLAELGDADGVYAFFEQGRRAAGA
ncbi:hypothetical protein [Nocardia alni]|uniref:hypothetical protein n=1 Tax=Nocardia alni TaxID=2815723 RepID=UPI001C228CFB|nr:hypothetical protein [Nocardia alni]